VAESDDELFGAEHVRVYRETAGDRGYLWRGALVLLLTTTGRTSGESRTTPLIHRTDGDDWVVIASKGGAPDHPDWYKNLKADPDATIQVKGDVLPVTATTAEGEERNRLWASMTEVWPSYDDYQRNTEREIPVVVFAHAVVAGVVLELGEPERLHQRWHVHREPPAQPLLQAVPAADGIGGVAPPGLDGPLLRRLLLVGATERHPVPVLGQHLVQVVQAAKLVAEPGLSDLAHEGRWIGRLVAVHRVLRCPRWRLEHPRILLRALARRACHRDLL